MWVMHEHPGSCVLLMRRTLGQGRRQARVYSYETSRVRAGRGVEQQLAAAAFLVSLSL